MSLVRSRWNPIAFVRDESDADPEPMGSKEKFWVDLPRDERQWLLKLARIDSRDGTVSGEDWAEWVVHRLSGLIGVPTAEVQAAKLDERRAILSRSVLHDGRESLDHGNSVLSSVFPGYDQAVKGENPGYTVHAVRDALEQVSLPLEGDLPAHLTAFDAWVGYLVMDAWLAGRDRHHENWAVVLRGDGRRLAPSFDHGNALSFQERDDRRLRMLSDQAHLERWAHKGVSRHFAGQPTLVDLALEGLRLAGEQARGYWMDRLAGVNEDDVVSIVHEVPDEIMSEVTRTFVVRLVSTNRRRLLDGYASS